MKKLASKGFTLIELLVVITIIGILATGATTVYTTAQQKARDSVRQSDLMGVKSALEQSYSDNAVYPAATATTLETDGYIDTVPSDPKNVAGTSDATTYQYVYGAADAASGIQAQLYEVSANFENSNNDAKETGDGGDDTDKWEVGNGTVDTSYDGTTFGTNTYNATAATDSVVLVD